MVKALLGYNLPKGLSEDDHLTWLRDTHLKDIAGVPGLQRIVLNRTERILAGGDGPNFLAELHYPDMETYRAARDWIKSNPFPPESQPEGQMLVKFFVVCNSEQIILT